MSEAAHGTEAAHGNEATHASKGFLDTVKDKTTRWLGHGAIAAGGEFFVNLGSATVAVGTMASVASGNPIPLALGLIPTAIGTTIEWQTALKYAGVKEKMAFWGAKIAATGAQLFAPAYATIASGMSAASALIGMRHRK